jgi:GSH-dependent disulfide-bond oxidoreductase
VSDMILYHGEPNGPSLTVLAALFESGVSAETRRIDLLGCERHNIAGLSEPVARDMGVEGEGPVLVTGGEAMTESVFIAQFLDESGKGDLQPKDAYAHWQMLMWCRRITERCAPAAAYLGCHALAQGSVSADLAPIKSDDLRARWAQIAAGDFAESTLADSRTKVSEAAVLVEEQLSDGRDWLMVDFTIADLETYSWLAGMALLQPESFANKLRLNAWLARVAARPALASALALAQSDDPRTAWAPGPEINRWG